MKIGSLVAREPAEPEFEGITGIVVDFDQDSDPIVWWSRPNTRGMASRKYDGPIRFEEYRSHLKVLIE
jgi:hypothetical protein